MAHAEASVPINRSVDEVFDFVLDGANNPRWQPVLMDVQRQSDTPLDVGAVFKQGLRGLGGRRMADDYQIVECIPNQSIEFRLIAGLGGKTGSYTFESRQDFI